MKIEEKNRNIGFRRSTDWGIILCVHMNTEYANLTTVDVCAPYRPAADRHAVNVSPFPVEQVPTIITK